MLLQEIKRGDELEDEKMELENTINDMNLNQKMLEDEKKELQKLIRKLEEQNANQAQRIEEMKTFEAE